MTSDVSHLPSLYERARARAQDAGNRSDWPQAARWAERAWRLAGRRPLPALELAAALTRTGDRRVQDLLTDAAKQHGDFPVLVALTASQLRDGDHDAAQATLSRLLATVAVDVLPPVAALAGEIAAWAGMAGWLGWRQGRLLLGLTRGTPDTIDLALGGQTLALEWTSDAAQIWSASLPPDAGGLLRASRPLLGAPLRPDLFSTLEGMVTRSATRVQGWVWFPHDPARQPDMTITIAKRGRRSEVAVRELNLVAPTETQPFARKWAFDVAVPAGAGVMSVTETRTGREIPTAQQGTCPAGDTHGTDENTGLDALLQRCRARECVLLVTHDEGGGIERHVQKRLDALRRAGKIGLLLRSQRDRPGTVALELAAKEPMRLAVSVLLDALRQVEPTRIEYHQPRRHDRLVWQLAASLKVPYDVHLHDYALLCPRVTLIGASGQYCGEPPVRQCERCIGSFEHRHLFAPAGVAALRRQSAELLEHAERVWAPSADIAARFRRHIPNIAITVRPWEAGKAKTHPTRAPGDDVPNYAHVCVVGAINHHKGFYVLLDCARNAAIQDLPIRFTVVGHTSDDDSLIEAGVFITGPYADTERAELIVRQQANVGFLPSIWPEPWCYSLTGLFEAGLPTLCFDIGAPADRVRAAGGCVLPLGAPVQDINQQILKLHRLTMDRQATVVAYGEAI